MKILFLSHTARTSSFRIGSHHLSSGLARRGHDVLHVSTPITLTHLPRAMRDRETRIRFELAAKPYRDESGVFHAVPPLPFPLGFQGRIGDVDRDLCDVWLKRAVRKYLHTGAADVAVVDQPTFAPLADRLPARKMIYRGTDIYTGERQARCVDQIGRAADAVIATSEVVLDSIPRRSPQTPHMVLPNGVEFERFAAASEWPRSGAVYVGALDARFDWQVVLALARAMPDEPVRLAGPRPTSVPELPANVELLGPVPYDSVPVLLAGAKVGLLPLSTDPTNPGRSPMKLFEYLAAGLYVIATKTPTLAALNAPGVLLYDSPQDACREYAQLLGHIAPNSAGVDAARDRDWEHNTLRLEQFIQKLPNDGG